MRIEEGKRYKADNISFHMTIKELLIFCCFLNLKDGCKRGYIEIDDRNAQRVSGSRQGNLPS
jgi:hypothetical protein